jgi:VCBS repeat protein
LAVTLALFVCWVAQGYAQAPLFAPASPVVVGPGSGEVFLADINQDGHLDLLTKHLLKQTLSVRSGDGKGHFVPALESSLSFDYQPGAVALGHVNNDGILDLGVASKDGDRENVRIFLGNPKGGFSLAPGSPFIASAPIQGYKPFLRFADLNRDGKPDIVTANGRRNTVEIFLGDGRAGFSPGAIVKLELGRWFYSFALGDIDGDDLLDLVTASGGHRPDSEPGRLATRRGNGRGSFAAPAGQTVSVPPDPRVAALVDVNGDGRLDVVLSHGRTNILSILLNGGKGTFTPRPGPPINVGFPASEVVAADVNGDQKVDLVTTVNVATAPFESKVVVLLGDGPGGFAPAPGSPFPVGPGAYRLAVADVNEDGKLDIAASSFEGNAVTLLLGR